MNQHTDFVRRGLAFVGFSLIALVIISLLAISSSASAISQGFFSDEQLASGTLVSLKESGRHTSVVPSESDYSSLVGVVVNKEESTVAVSNGENQVQVATSGIANLYVTDLYGPIQTGDPIGISPIRGVGAKAITNGKIVGIAQTDFDPSQADRTVSVQKSGGETEEAKVGSVLVAVQVGYYAVSAEEGQHATGLQQVGNTLAGRPVSAVKVIMSLIIALSGMLAAAVILYSGIKSSFTAVGRNPLARLSIFRGLKRVSVFSFLIFIVAMSVGYGILRL